MIEAVALAVVCATGVFFLMLGALALLASPRARSFLLAFAGSPVRHYTELAVRVFVGGAFVLAAPLAAFSAAFNFFGWVILCTTVVLLLVPWQWHHRFAAYMVPQALRFLPLLGASSVTLGALVLWAVWKG